MDGNQSTDEDAPTEADNLESTVQSADVVGSHVRRLLLLAFVGLMSLGVYMAQIQPSMLQTLVMILVFALFAIAFDFAFGFSGMYSFGHAAMFGIGGYATGYLLKEVTTSGPVVLFAAIIAGVLMALLIGIIGAKTTGIYFAMITLAFAQIVYILTIQDVLADLLGHESITGGDNGLFGIPSMTVPGLDIANSMLEFYLFALILVSASTVLILRIANSQFGSVLRAIQQNEMRVTHLGYNVGRYKLAGFGISGGFSGLAGGLLVAFQGIAHPNTLLHWLVSGDIIFMAILGGVGTLWGPMLGAGLYVYFEESLYWFPHWRLLLAAIIVGVIIFFPDGLAGILRSGGAALVRLRDRFLQRSD